MVALGQVVGLAYVDVEGNLVVPEAHDAFLCTLNNLVSIYIWKDISVLLYGL